MAKTVPSNMKVKGKLGDIVYVDSKYGHHARKAPAKGVSKEAHAFRDQNARTRVLSKLAGEINQVIERYHPVLKENNFYTRLHKLFRQEPLDIRFFLLARLKGMEVNENYPLQKLGACSYEVRATPKKIIVTLFTEQRPPKYIAKYRPDSYYNSVMLMCWNKPKSPATVFRSRTKWIPINDNTPVFDFEFEKPAGTTHWLLFHRQCLGKHDVAIESLKAEGMRVADVGSFDNIELAMLEKANMEREKARQDEKGRRDEEEDEGKWVGERG